jgi:hypothetical protein
MKQINEQTLYNTEAPEAMRNVEHGCPHNEDEDED